MKPRFKIWTLSLVAVMAVSACASAVPVAPAPQATIAPPTVITSAPSIVETPTSALSVVETPIATSRGPNLESTDPTTVALASGGLQLVEFFRFT